MLSFFCRSRRLQSVVMTQSCPRTHNVCGTPPISYTFFEHFITFTHNAIALTYNSSPEPLLEHFREHSRLTSHTKWTHQSCAAAAIHETNMLSYRDQNTCCPDSVHISGDFMDPENSCCICYRNYCFTDIEQGTEVPVQLACRHVFGGACIEIWASTNNNCPLCRGN